MAQTLNDRYDPVDRYRAVVEHRSGLLVVVAGPGTGKTFSLLRKIERLLEDGVQPQNIYYLTFVNSIVCAFKDDIRKEKDKGGLDRDPDVLGIRVSTLHSLALKVVNTYAHELNLPHNLEIIELSTHSSNILTRIFVDDLYALCKRQAVVNDKRDFNKLLGELTDIWRCNGQPDGRHELLEQIADKLCSAYWACSWDKLVVLASRAIRENGLPKWLASVEHYLIDEYQDFNPAEQRLMRLITRPSDSVVIVGDPDQSIYSGRSASPRGMLKLLELNDTFTVNFVYCWRCAGSVLAAANNMLKHMDPEGFSAKRLRPYKSCKAEVMELATAIRTELDSGNSDIILLFPTRAARNFYCSKFRKAGVNCSVPAADVKGEFEAMMQLVLLKSQPLIERLLLQRFNRLVAFYARHVLPGLMNTESSILESIRACDQRTMRSKEIPVQLHKYAQLLEDLISDDTPRILRAFAASGLEIEPELVSELLLTDHSYPARDRVQQALATIDYERQEDNEASPEVALLTMHGSKGLSKHTVIIPAFEDKLLPGTASEQHQSELERLIYVAVTRAKDTVLITCPNTRAPKDPLNYKLGISRYARILTVGSVL